MPIVENADGFVTPRGQFPLVKPDDIEELRLHPIVSLCNAVSYIGYPKAANEYQKIHEEGVRQMGFIKRTYTYHLALESIEAPDPSLIAVKRDGEWYVMLADFIAWADSKQCFVPKWLRALYQPRPMTPPEERRRPIGFVQPDEHSGGKAET